MPANLLSKGTLLIPSGTHHDPDKKHLHVICSDPSPEGFQVIVSLATWTNDLCDSTCKIQAHEHEFLHTLSYVHYRHSRIEASTTLRRGVAEKIFIPRQDMNGQTYLRIVKGFCNSKQTPRKVKTYLNCPPGAA